MPGTKAAPARYQEIELWLRERTMQGTPGDSLPSEAELAARFKVSRMTARQAVQNLAQEGLVVRRKGSGTYIAEQPLHRHEGILLSFSEDMRRRGMSATSRLLDASLRPATAADVEALRLEPDDRVVSIVRIRCADGIPLSVERAALPVECAGVLGVDLESGSLHAALTEIGRIPVSARSWISARMPTAEEAKHLEITGLKEPLLSERRIILDEANLPIEHTESAYIASRYVIDATFRMAR